MGMHLCRLAECCRLLIGFINFLVFTEAVWKVSDHQYQHFFFISHYDFFTFSIIHETKQRSVAHRSGAGLLAYVAQLKVCKICGESD